MAHEILENMYAGTQSAWHSLGIVDPSLTSAVDAVHAGNMDFVIHKLPLRAIIDENTSVAFDAYGLVRGPTNGDNNYVSLGTCSGDYDFFQNVDIADRIDMLSSETGWKFATAGVLGKGETIFICLHVGNTTIANDDTGKFFTYVETRNGKVMARGYVSRVRTVCKNTLDLGLASASSKIGLRHYSEYKQDADWVLGMVAQAEQAGANIDTALNKLASIQVTEDMYQDMLSAVAPMPNMPSIMTMPNLTRRMADKRKKAEYVYELKANTASKTREAVNAIYQSASDIAPKQRGTAWHAYNAVTHYTTHTHGTLGERGRKMSVASRAKWDLFDGGQEMRNAAYEVLAGELFN
jgi:phage/plasmid-like protein (TIGR03299 family)